MRSYARPPQSLKESNTILNISYLTSSPASRAHDWVSNMVFKIQIIYQSSQSFIQNKLNNDVLF